MVFVVMESRGCRPCIQIFAYMCVCELWCFTEYQQRQPAGPNCSKIQALACHSSTSTGTAGMEGGEVLELMAEAC